MYNYRIGNYYNSIHNIITIRDFNAVTSMHTPDGPF